MGLMDLFRPKWNHPDFGVRMQALQEVHDQKTILRIARKAKDSAVRREAVEKLKDEVLLAGIAKEDPRRVSRRDWVSFAALEKLTHAEFLADVAANAKSGAIRVRALEKLRTADHALAAKLGPEITVPIHSDWMHAIWSNGLVHLPANVDVHGFFEQRPMPPLWPHDTRYARQFETDEDRTAHWIAALLHHPDDDVVLRLFRYWGEERAGGVVSALKTPCRRLLLQSAADHLLNANPAIVGACARFLWREYSEENFEILFSALADPAYPDAPMAIKRLSQCCPLKHRASFERVVGQHQDILSWGTP